MRLKFHHIIYQSFGQNDQHTDDFLFLEPYRERSYRWNVCPEGGAEGKLTGPLKSKKRSCSGGDECDL